MHAEFNTTKTEQKIIVKIADRIMSEIEHYGDKIDAHMDISACHCNGTPLDLKRLLDYDMETFAHDVLGIRRHINRRTGKLERCLLPRCAKG